MKFTIEGFSQEYAMTLRKQVEVKGKIVTKQIDCTDLVILRWFVDFYPNMKKIEVDGKQYAWLTHKKLQQDLPIIDISKRSFIDRMQKLVDFEILDYKLLKEGGTFSLYGFGKNYNNIVSSDRVQSNDTGSDEQTHDGMQSNNTGVVQSNHTGYAVQPTNKDNSIKDNSFKDTSINIHKDIIDYLNKAAGTKFRHTTNANKQNINGRLHEGFTLEDFKVVIDKKCAEWKGTEFEKYLRPSTLFGSKFEGYLNAHVKAPKKYGSTGIEIKQGQQDDDDLAGIL